MSQTNCVIQFTDEDDSDSVFVERNRHGHPENVITNLYYLRDVTITNDFTGHPGEIAAQFLFLDKLWYLRKAGNGFDLRTEVENLTQEPETVGSSPVREHLGLHRIRDDVVTVDEETFLYAVAVSSSSTKEWGMQVAHLASPVKAETDAFEAVDWDFSGSLSEADRSISFY